MQNIKRAVDFRYQTRLIYTVTKHNLGDVDRALSLAEDIGVNMISFHFFTQTGHGRNHPELQVQPQEWIEFCSWLRTRKVSDKLNVFYPPAFVKSEDISSMIDLGYMGCTARNLERFAIFPDKRCYICSMFFDTNIHYGEFHDGGIVPTQNSQGISESTLVSHISNNCKTCQHGAICRGGCAAYYYFDMLISPKNCDGKIVPLCPLWSVSASNRDTPSIISELR